MDQQILHSDYDLDNHGLNIQGEQHWNLTPAECYEQALQNGEAILAAHGPLRVLTGQYTGRSPKDKFVVEQDSSKDQIWWGEINQPMTEERSTVDHDG